MKTATSPRRAPAAGFTLVEVIVTTAIISMVVGSTASFFIHALGIYHYDSGKLLVNRDIRAFTS